MKIISLILLSLISFSAFSQPKVTAQKFFQYLTGTPLSATDVRVAQLTSLLNQQNFKDAYNLVSQDPQFYRKTVFGLSRKLLLVNFEDEVPLNDFDLTLFGVVRDQLNAKLLLTGDFVYLPEVSNSRSKGQRQDFQRYFQKPDIITNLKKISPQWDDAGDDFAGLLTTAGFSSIHYAAGTNRRPVKYALANFMCAPIEMWRSASGPEYFIRRDINRSPGGKPDDFKNECRSCHSVMDSLSGAFAMVDELNPQVVATILAPKMNANSWMYPQGYNVRDKSWVNYISSELDSYFGWRSERTGDSLKSFGEMLANASGYSNCLVKHSYDVICRRPIASQADFKTLSQNFEKNDYNINKLFIDIVSSDSCIQ